MYSNLKFFACVVIIFIIINYVYRKELFKNDEVIESEPSASNSEEEQRKKYIEKLVYVKITKNLKGLENDSRDDKSKKKKGYTDEIDVFANLLSPELKVLNNILDSKMKKDKMKKFLESIQKRVNDINYKKMTKSIKKNNKKLANNSKLMASSILMMPDKALADKTKNKRIKKIAKIIKKKIVKKVASRNEANLNNLTIREKEMIKELSGKLGDDIKVKFDVILLQIYTNIIKENNRRYKQKNQSIKNSNKNKNKKLLDGMIMDRRRDVADKQKRKIKSLINIVKKKVPPPGELKKETVI